MAAVEPVVEGVEGVEVEVAEVEVAEVEVVEVVSAAPCGELNSQEATMDIQNTSPLRYSEDAQDAMRDSIQAMAALIGQLQRREQALEDLVRQQLQLLQQAANRADQRVSQVVQDALPRLTQLSNQALTQSLEPAVTRFNKKMVDADQTLQHATHRYAQAQQSLQAMVTRRMWIGLSVIIIGALLCVGGAAYALKAAQAGLAQAAQHRAEIGYLDRVARADLAPCGADRLCAVVEKKGARYGDQGQYRVIALRASPSQ
ncbi:hypothetical protein [Xanthomonas citri]|uniref:hypothetical protein n=1 Tax=Xanthomonas citri TaxID=346 RepID=UPI00058F052E